MDGGVWLDVSKNGQFERDIARVVSGEPAHGELDFQGLIRSDQPGAMRAAEEFLRRKGWRLREVTGALHARNFTIDPRPLWGPGHEWKMVQVNVAPEGKRGRIWTKMTVANGVVRVTREREFSADIDEARKTMVANAWAVAKAIKYLPLDTDKHKIEAIVDRHFKRRSENRKGIEDIL